MCCLGFNDDKFHTRNILSDLVYLPKQCAFICIDSSLIHNNRLTCAPFSNISLLCKHLLQAFRASVSDAFYYEMAHGYHFEKLELISLELTAFSIIQFDLINFILISFHGGMGQNVIQ